MKKTAVPCLGRMHWTFSSVQFNNEFV